MLLYVPREKIPKLLEICNSKGTAIKKADSLLTSRSYISS